MNATREQVEQLKAQLEAAKEVLDAKEWAQAREQYEAALEAAQAANVQSSYLLWCLSLVLHELGAVEEAFDRICEAVVLDAMHPTLHGRFSEASDALRRQLVTSSKAPDSHDPRALYGRLLRTGEADVTSHLAMARVHLMDGAVEAAAALVSATLLLDPSREEAWALHRDLAERRGDPQAVAEATERLENLAGHAPPFGVPAPRARC